MNAKLFAQNLRRLTSHIRKREIQKAKKLFLSIIKIDVVLTKEVIFAIYDFGKVSRKDGVLSSVTDSDYVLDNRIIIPKARVVRVEVQG